MSYYTPPYYTPRYRAAQTCPQGYTRYTIRAGDTFYRLAARYGVGLEELLAANPGVNPDRLQIGQQVCVPARRPGECPPGYTTYRIQAGDTFYRLARELGTTVNDLLQANPGVDPERLRVGQEICVPAGPEPLPCPIGSIRYTIRAGDTLYSIARRYNTTVQAILDANPGLDPNYLQVGRIICVPQRDTVPSTRCPAGYTLYTIRAGDTLYAIARARNTTVAALLAANPGIDPNRLQIGQRICVPQ